jgi:hypothetical protein
MAIEVDITKRFRVGQSDNLLVDCRAGLRKNETITGVTSCVSVPTGLTLSNQQVNGAAIEIEHASVPPGKALAVALSGGTPGQTYEVVFTVATSEAPAVMTQGIWVNCY